MGESERLARRWFAIVQEGAFERLADLVHPDVVLVSKVRPGEVVRGREAFGRFVDEVIAGSLYEATPERFTTVDDERVIAEGRIRWIDDERVIRDDPVIWAIEFRDGLLFRFTPAHTVLEAETILSARDDPAPTAAG